MENITEQYEELKKKFPGKTKIETTHKPVISKTITYKDKNLGLILTIEKHSKNDKCKTTVTRNVKISSQYSEDSCRIIRKQLNSFIFGSNPNSPRESKEIEKEEKTEEKVQKGEEDKTLLEIVNKFLQIVAELPVSTEKNVADEKIFANTSDIFERITWDSEFDKDRVTIGYIDRFVGLMEADFTAFSDNRNEEDGVPFHRIRYFKIDDEVVWSRDEKLDLISNGKWKEELIKAASKPKPAKSSKKSDEEYYDEEEDE